jgi:hypothetical protein
MKTPLMTVLANHLWGILPELVGWFVSGANHETFLARFGIDIAVIYMIIKDSILG